MRILKLRFENINSLRGLHEVDFQDPAFRHSNLFAIVGPTGSGKTTLLDVITLTLYNRIPRLGKVSVSDFNGGAVLSRGTQRATAEVTFQGHEGVFRAKWSLEKTVVKRGERKGTFDWKETLELATADGTILAEKKSDVLELTRLKVGLDYEQFVKSILLSQGDFAAFLKADFKDRSALLEKITGTAVYRAIGMRAYEKWHDEKKKEIDREREKIQHIPVLSDDDVATRQTRQAELLAQQNVFFDEKESVGKTLKTKTDLAERQTLLDRLDAQEVPALEARRQQFDADEAPRLRRHEALLQHASSLARHETLSRQQTDEQARAEILRTARQAATQNRDALLVSLQNLLGKPVSEETAAMELEAFREEISRLDTARQVAEGQVNAARKSVGEKMVKVAAPAVATAWRQAQPDESLAALREHWKALKKQQADLQQLENLSETDDLTTLSEQTTRRRNELQELLTQVELYQRLVRQISHDGEPKGYRQRIGQLKETIEHLGLPRQRARQLVGEKRQAFTDTLDRKYELLKQSTLPRLKAELATDEPCPVCGSRHHPAGADASAHQDALMAYLSDLKAIDQEIEVSGQQIEEAEKSLRQVETTILLTNEQSQEFSLRIEETQSQQADIQAVIAPLKTRLSLERIGKTDEVRAWVKTADERLQHLSRLAAIRPELDAAKELAEALTDYQTTHAALETARAAFTARYPGDLRQLASTSSEWVQKLARRDHQPQQVDEELKTAESGLKTVQDELKTLESALLPALQTAGFATPNDARLAQLTATDYQTLSHTRQALLNDEAALQTRREALRRECTELTAQDDPTTDAHTLTTRLAELTAAEKVLADEAARLNVELENDAKNRRETAEKQEKIRKLEEKSKKWQLLSDAIGDRRGDAFNRFAQRLTLGHLVRGANHHLRDLSERYLLLPPEAEEEDLWILDLNFDERRAVNTLSGGETFLVSLALALGLSDLVSQNVKLESLFIDEGFGTLDPETLEMVLGTLEKLQSQSGKLIGIISHVEALKERITTQIRLKKHAGGFSELEIV
ncbi:MAG: AAA family ATPase [Cytophagaceae bacterium]|nr:AAA family ATPase [Cytophagaceae bacterium]